MCLFVCTIEPKRLKLQSPNLLHGQSIMSSGYPFNIRSKGISSKVQGHKVQKHISGDRVAGMSLHSIECPASSYTANFCVRTDIFSHGLFRLFICSYGT